MTVPPIASCIERAQADLARVRGAPSGARLPEAPALGAVLPAHRALLAHAIELQRFTYSAGAAGRTALRPLWLEVLFEGEGVRRITGEIVDQSDHLLAAFGLPLARSLAEQHVRDPSILLALGLADLAERAVERADVDPAARRELSLNVRAFHDPLDPEVIAEALRFEDPLARIRMLCRIVSYTINRGGAPPPAIVEALAAAVTRMRSDDDELSYTRVRASTVVLACNALNYVGRSNGRFDEVAERLGFIGRSLLPRVDGDRMRDHLRGNWHYQRALMSARAGDAEAEIEQLAVATALDRHFVNVDYRLAEILHDRGAKEAGVFYELALALSPIDYPTANDYGCFLSDAGLEKELASWEQVCRLLFPERFEEAPG